MKFPGSSKMAALLTAGLFFLSVPAWAASDTEQLRREMAFMKTSLENANARLAEAMNQLTVIQQEFNAMKGVTEGGNYFQQEQSRSLREYDQRITALEDKITTLMTLLKEIKESGGTSVSKGGSMDEGQAREFQRLLDYINTEDYAKALPGFQGFLQKYPKSPVADNAQYWIAESYYGLNDFKKAITEYQVLIQKYPRSSKTKSALLKQGLSFFGLKMYPEARPFFEKVISEYPSSPEASRANTKLKEIDKLMAAAPATQPAPVPPMAPTPAPMVPPGAPPLHSPGGTIRMPEHSPPSSTPQATPQPVDRLQPARQQVPVTHSIYD